MTAGSAGDGRHALDVTVSAGSLPDEVVARINRAVQRAVLAELADLDLGPGFRVELLTAEKAQLVGPGHTDGIRVELEASAS